ncbi:MAG: hypothetical protein P1U88_13125 [Thalassobaculaceae bacterium]|nr:hypothetical protein [Thalassobaculaceae bacterium]
MVAQILQLSFEHVSDQRRAGQDLAGEQPGLLRSIARHLMLAPDIAADLVQRLAGGVEGDQRLQPGLQLAAEHHAVDLILAVSK